MAPRSSLHSTRPGLRPARSGFTLLEVTIAIVVLVLSLQVFSQSYSTMARLEPAASRRAIAVFAARNVAEQVRATPFEDLVTAYGQDAAGAPWGATAADLDLVRGAPEGLLVTVTLPIVGGVLREDANLPLLGMPMDLNADGVIDALDHGLDYLILPARIQATWTDGGSQRTYDLTLLVSGSRS